MNDYLIPLISFIPFLALGLILTLKRIDLKLFQGLFIFAAVGLVLIDKFYIGAPLWKIIVPLVGVELLHLLLLGLLNRQMTHSNHEAILFGVGLFPWFLSITPSSVYVVSFFMGMTVYTFIKFNRASKAVNVRSNSVKDIRKKLSPEDFKIFESKAAIFLAPVFLICGLLGLVTVIF